MKTRQSRKSDDEPASPAGRVVIFDTTLRDGEQAPGFSLDHAAKLKMARMLESLGVDVIEAGFPQASPDDFAAVAKIAGEVREATVCGLARCVAGDIDRAAQGIWLSRCEAQAGFCI